MKKRIVSVAPHKAALTLSLTFAAFSLVIVIPMSLMMLAMPTPIDAQGNSTPMPFGWIFVIVMPILYFVIGYIFTGLTALIYNLVAKFTGGLVFVEGGDA